MRGRTQQHDEYGRKWGSPLWRNGPILGGRNHREWVQRLQQDDMERERIFTEPVYVDHSRDADTRRRAALKYALATIGSETSPLAMVEAILAGERDDVVRTIL
jgi:hypothetical protein